MGVHLIAPLYFKILENRGMFFISSKASFPIHITLKLKRHHSILSTNWSFLQEVMECSWERSLFMPLVWLGVQKTLWNWKNSTEQSMVVGPHSVSDYHTGLPSKPIPYNYIFLGKRNLQMKCWWSRQHAQKCKILENIAVLRERYWLWRQKNWGV